MPLPKSAPPLFTFSAAELAQLIASGDVSSVEVVDTHITRIQAVDRTLNAVAVERFDAARRDAREADEALRRGEIFGPLHGVPITVKECLDVLGAPSTFGMPSRKFDTAKANDPYVQRLVEAGAIIIAKTNVPQALFSAETTNAVYGRTRSPWNLARTPGGSTGGESALIAAGGSPLGIGTDIGGSMRIPANWCGLASLKPTAPRTLDMSRYYLIPHAEAPILSVIGPMAREVDDVALATRVIADIPNPHVPTPQPLADWTAVDVSQLRVAYYTDDGLLSPSPAVKRAVLEAVEILKAAGARVTEWTPPDLQRADDLYVRIVTADKAGMVRAALGKNAPISEIRALLFLAQRSRRTLGALGRVLRAMGQERLVRSFDNFGFTRDDLPALATEMHDYTRAFGQAMDHADGGPFDLIVSPVIFSPAWTHGASQILTSGGSYSILYNLMRYPAGVVPVTRVQLGEETAREPSRDFIESTARKMELGSAGLPIGVQVAARPWQEHVALAAMKVIQTGARQSASYPITPIDPPHKKKDDEE